MEFESSKFLESGGTKYMIYRDGSLHYGMLNNEETKPVKKRDKLAAIKAVRTRTGVPFREAKAAVKEVERFLKSQ